MRQLNHDEILSYHNENSNPISNLCDGERLIELCKSYNNNMDEVLDIVRRSPQSIAYLSEDGFPPLWFACGQDSIHHDRYSDLILYLIREGIRRFLWPGSKGGLTKTFGNPSTYSPLELLVKKGNCEMLRSLAKKQKYPLLRPSDISKYHLLDISRHPGVAQFLIDMDPSAVLTRDSTGSYPVQYIQNNKMDSPELSCLDIWQTEIVLVRKGLLHGTEGFGGYFLPKRQIKQLREYQKQENYDEFRWEKIAESLGGVSNNWPIIQDAIKYLPAKFMKSNLASILKSFDCVETEDEKGRLPLFFALDYGLGWYEGLKDIFDAGDDHGSDNLDKDTGLYPFALAATGENYKYRADNDENLPPNFCPGHCSDLNTIFILLKNHVQTTSTIKKH